MRSRSAPRLAIGCRLSAQWFSACRLVLLWLACGGTAGQWASAQEGNAAPASEPKSAVSTKERPASESTNGDKSKQPLKPAPVPLSDAERIANLQLLIQADEARLKELQKALDDPQSSYAEADKAFQEISTELDSLKKAAKQAEADGETQRLADLNQKMTTAQTTWDAAKRRFELEIEARKTRKASLDALTVNLKSNQDLLEKLRNPETVPPAAPATPPSATMPAPANTAPTAPATDATPGLPVNPLVPMLPAAPSSTATPANATANDPNPSDVKDEVVLEAESEFEKRKLTVDAAEAELQEITQRIETLQQNIMLSRRLRDLARQKAIEADAETQQLRDQYWKELSAGEAATETGAKMEAAQSRLRAAEEESQETSDHLEELQNSMMMMRGDQVGAIQRTEQLRRELDQAQAALNAVSRPWSPHRIERWLTNQGVRILTVIIGAFLVLWLALALRQRFAVFVIDRIGRGTSDERENRARTLVGVFHSTFVTFVYTVASVLILEALGFSVAPLLGGAAVLGLAVAFGAQSLIKDYFTGFIVLLEQQYMLNDVVKINNLTGQVEHITLRMTVLRDLEGSVHFIPHGQITFVTNMTHGWSRAVFDIQISYESDIDRATLILMELARDLRREAAYASLITQEPALLGVDSLGPNGVTIKFHITTRPLQQWTVKREMLRRIKQRFDQERIVIPYPQLQLRYGSESNEVTGPPLPPNPLLS